VQYPASLRSLTGRSDTDDDGGGRGIGHKPVPFSGGRARFLLTYKTDWFYSYYLLD
jgi:hypothetical protein